MSEKGAFRLVMVLSVVVFITVLVLNRKLITPPDMVPAFVFKLPLLNAIINGTCSVLLILSFLQVKKRNFALHKTLNLIAFALSSLFLVFYVLYHFFAEHTEFGGEGIVSKIYYFILVTHIILAAVVLPLVLLSFYHGLYNNVEKHRKLVRFSFPIWLYVTVTGVVVYLMISPYYKF